MRFSFSNLIQVSLYICSYIVRIQDVIKVAWRVVEESETHESNSIGEGIEAVNKNAGVRMIYNLNYNW